MFLFYSLLPALFSLPVYTMALPQGSQVTSTNEIGNLTTSNSLLKCTDNPSRQWTVFPTQKDCASAMRALPTVPDITTFHTGGDDDGYKLPTFERFKNCEILIEGLGPSGISRSSWIEVGLAATELSLACLDNEHSSPGGVTYTGAANGIKITLRGYSRRSEAATSS